MAAFRSHCLLFTFTQLTAVATAELREEGTQQQARGSTASIPNGHVTANALRCGPHALFDSDHSPASANSVPN